MKNTIEENKLNKKLHLKKLINFLSLYRYVVFYQSHKINTKNGFVYTKAQLRDKAHSKSKTADVLFLVNCGRLRKLIILKLAQLLSDESRENQKNQNNQEKDAQKLKNLAPAGISKLQSVVNHEIMFFHTPDTFPEGLEMSLVQQGDKIMGAHKIMLQFLRLFTKPLFSTTLVGCDSLESMQKCIQENLGHSNTSAEDFSCLGGIYNNSYIDKIDCFTLAQINAQSVHLDLTNRLTQSTQLLLKQLLWFKFSLKST